MTDSDDLLSFDLNTDRRRVMEELARIGFGDLSELFDSSGAIKPIKDWSPNARRSVSSYKCTEVETASGVKTTFEVKVWDKNSALEKLAKIMGLYDDGGKSAFGSMKDDPAIRKITDETSAKDAAEVYAGMLAINR